MRCSHIVCSKTRVGLSTGTAFAKVVRLAEVSKSSEKRSHFCQGAPRPIRLAPLSPIGRDGRPGDLSGSCHASLSLQATQACKRAWQFCREKAAPWDIERRAAAQSATSLPHDAHIGSRIRAKRLVQRHQQRYQQRYQQCVATT